MAEEGKRGFAVIQGGIRDIPEPPFGLPEAVHPEWKAIAQELHDRKELDEVVLSVIEAYCTALWQIRDCRKAIAADGTFVKGQNGVPKAHPASTMMQKAQETVNRLSSELGITPAARARRSGRPSSGDKKDGIDEFV